MQDDYDNKTIWSQIDFGLAMRAHDLNRQSSADTRKAAIESANVAIRSLILVNGGAVVALLAFVASLETGDSGNSIKVQALASPILYFAIGVGLSAVLAALAYLVNLLDSEIIDAVKLTWEHPYIERKEQSSWLWWFRMIMHWSALATGIAALVFFFCGIFGVTSAISELGI